MGNRGKWGYGGKCMGLGEELLVGRGGGWIWLGVGLPVWRRGEWKMENGKLFKHQPSPTGATSEQRAEA